MIEVQGVQKAYGSVIAAGGIDLTVSEGSLVALTGSSGSGKSTLLHLIGAVDRPDAGVIRVGDTVVTDLRGKALAEYRRSIGFVFQRYNLLPALTALDNVISPVLPYRTAWDKADRASDLLEQVGLGGRERSLPSQLSGGEQQRVGIARALMSSPSVLLADEPTGNLDSQNGRAVLDLLLQLREDTGMTVLLATHDAQVAARCDRLIRLRDGLVVDDLELSAGSSPEETLRRVTGYAGPS